MKLFESKLQLVGLTVLTIAGLLHQVEAADNSNQFRKCYNISDYTHCFDAGYDTKNNRWLTASFDVARKHCSNLNSTLLIINDEETDRMVRQYLDDPYNPSRFQYVWMDAYRVSDNNRAWHWVDTTLPTMKALDVTFLSDFGWYVVVLEFRDNSFQLTAKQPHNGFSYICEYAAAICSSGSFNNARLFSGRCYNSFNDQVSWYEARNKCLKDGGDLASFPNITSINFTSWLGSNPDVRFWIGLRFTWYIWIDTGEEVKYSRWIKNDQGWNSFCLIVWYNFIPSFSWSPKDCNTPDNVFVVCHTVTSINPTTTTAITTTSTTTTTTSTLRSSESFQSHSDNPSKENSENRTPSVIAIGVGVGVGVGVPVLVAVTVLIVCIVVRKRRHETASSVKSTNRQQAESPIDQPIDERSEVGDNTTYGVVIPSKSPRQAADADEPISAEQTVYAPLQIL